MKQVPVGVWMNGSMTGCLRKVVNRFSQEVLGSSSREARLRNTPSELNGVVRFDGGWKGHCSVQLDWPGARYCASAMLGLVDEPLSDQDIRDAVGEFSNVIAGMVQPMLPPGTLLGLPEVVSPSALTPLAGQSQCLANLAFNVDGQHIEVAVFAHGRDPRAHKELFECEF